MNRDIPGVDYAAMRGGSLAPDLSMRQRNRELMPRVAAALWHRDEMRLQELSAACGIRPDCIVARVVMGNRTVFQSVETRTNRGRDLTRVIRLHPTFYPPIAQRLKMPNPFADMVLV